MPFFVEERKLTSKSQRSNTDNEDTEIWMLVTAKKMGLSFEELNLFSLNDYITFVNKWVGEENDSSRHADQNDIDKLLS